MDINPLSLLDIKTTTATFTRDYDIQKAPGSKEFSNAFQRAKDEQTRANVSNNQPTRDQVVERNHRKDAVKQAQKQEKDSEEIKREADDKASYESNTEQASASNAVRARQEDAKKSDAAADENTESQGSENDAEEHGQLLPQVTSKNGKALQFEENEENNPIFVPVSIVSQPALIDSKLTESGFNHENLLMDAATDNSAESDADAEIVLIGEQAKIALGQNKQDVLPEQGDENVDVLKDHQSGLILNIPSAEDKESKVTLAIQENIEGYKSEIGPDGQGSSQHVVLVTDQQNELANTNTSTAQTQAADFDVAEDNGNESAGTLSSALDLSDSMQNQEENGKKSDLRRANVVTDEVKNNATLSILAPKNTQEKTSNEGVVGESGKLEKILNAMEQSSVDEPAALTAKSNVVKTASEFSRLLSGAKQPLRETIEIPVTHKNWGEALAEKTLLLVSQKGSSARLNLVPHNLGPLEIKLQLQGDSSAIEFVAHHAPTKEAIESAIPKLREMFESGGLSLGDVNVRDHSKHSRGHEQNVSFARNNDKEQAVTLPVELPVEALKMGRVDYIV